MWQNTKFAINSSFPLQITRFSNDLLIKWLQLDHSQMAFVVVVVFINIQLTIDKSLSQGFSNQINEAITKMNMFLMLHYVYLSE